MNIFWYKHSLKTVFTFSFGLNFSSSFYNKTKQSLSSAWWLLNRGNNNGKRLVGMAKRWPGDRSEFKRSNVQFYGTFLPGLWLLAYSRSIDVRLMEVQLCNKTSIRLFSFSYNIEQLLDEDFVISGVNLALRGRDPFVQRRRSPTR